MSTAPKIHRTTQPGIVPICGNCRHHKIDEHGGGRNECTVLADSERYKYAVNHTCDTVGWLTPLAFQPNYFQLEGVVEDLLSALHEYMAQFGQGLEAYEIPFGPAQQAADAKARAAIAKAEGHA